MGGCNEGVTKEKMVNRNTEPDNDDKQGNYLILEINGNKKPDIIKKTKENIIVEKKHIKNSVVENTLKDTSFSNIFANDSSDKIESIYSVKENLPNGENHYKSAEVVFLIEFLNFKKYSNQIKKIIEVLAHDIKNYFESLNLTNKNELVKLTFIKYSSSNLIEPKIFDLANIYNSLNFLDSELKQGNQGGEILAINKAVEIKFKENAAIFIFHFCGDFDNKDENQSKNLNEDILIEIRELPLKYEVCLFNKQSNEPLIQKLNELISLDVNRIMV